MSSLLTSLPLLSTKVAQPDHQLCLLQVLLTITPEDVHIVLQKLKNIPKAPKLNLVIISHFSLILLAIDNYNFNGQIRLATWDSVLTACWEILNRKYDQKQVFCP